MKIITCYIVLGQGNDSHISDTRVIEMNNVKDFFFRNLKLLSSLGEFNDNNTLLL